MVRQVINTVIYNYLYSCDVQSIHFHQVSFFQFNYMHAQFSFLCSYSVTNLTQLTSSGGPKVVNKSQWVSKLFSHWTEILLKAWKAFFFFLSSSSVWSTMILNVLTVFMGLIKLVSNKPNIQRKSRSWLENIVQTWHIAARVRIRDGLMGVVSNGRINYVLIANKLLQLKHFCNSRSSHKYNRL